MQNGANSAQSGADLTLGGVCGLRPFTYAERAS